MRTSTLLRLALLAGLLGSVALATPPTKPPLPAKPESQAQPASADRDQARELARTRAVIKIERPEGVCLWQILGSDGMVRLPVKDSGYANILLSAQIVGEEVQIAVAGEGAALETSVLGRYVLDYRGAEVETPPGKGALAIALRFGGRGPWTFSLASRHDFFAHRTQGKVAGCCTCETYRITCCPVNGICFGCGTCGGCCG